jgi:hypothetical protein
MASQLQQVLQALEVGMFELQLQFAVWVDEFESSRMAVFSLSSV